MNGFAALDIPPCRRYVVVKATAGFAVCRLILKLLLFYSCLDFTQNLGKTHEENPASSPGTLFPSLFDFYREHKDFYTILYQAGMTSILQETILNTSQITSEMSNLEAYMKSFWAYGIYGWMIEWIKRGMPESGDELTRLFILAEHSSGTHQGQ